ncbi:hypothetical protein HDU85_006646 [Gaertneriomyces sp. JEL0708]|nr:hypothetical protein HDU85_006646 [Gaertneriomyces sp. JEL0708]
MPGLSIKPQIALLSLSIGVGAIVRLLSNGPNLPFSCSLLGRQCPDWPINGMTDPGFEKVQQVFVENFQNGDEIGASFAAWMDGKPVVQLNGGYFDTDYDEAKPYTDSSLNLVFSSSKAVTGIAIAHMVSKGHFSYDDKVSKYWPEFAAGKKENVTIAQLMGHQGGVAALDPERAPTPEDILDLDKLAAMIAGQPHNFSGEPKTAYHAVTRGWFVNELVRRADPQHRSLGRYIQEEVAGPLNVPFYFGVPPSQEKNVAPLQRVPIVHTFFHVFAPASWQEEPMPALMRKAVTDRTSWAHKCTMASGPSFPWYELWPAGYNRKEVLKAEAPSYGGVTNAPALARLAAIMANNGTDPVTGEEFISRKTLAEAYKAFPVQYDVVMEADFQFLQGGWGRMPHLVQGQEWTGWAGAGGSMIWWNPSENLAFAYVPSAMKFNGVGDKRSWRLIEAFIGSVDKIRNTGWKGIRRVGNLPAQEPPTL